MPMIYNDEPAGVDGSFPVPTTPTLKLARHGGGVVGGPVRVYTSNPFTFVHQGEHVVAHETILEAHRYRQPEAAILAGRGYQYSAGLYDAPTPGGPVRRGGQFVMPDTSIGGLRVSRLAGQGNYPAPAAKPQSRWEGLLGRFGLQRKG